MTPRADRYILGSHVFSKRSSVITMAISLITVAYMFSGCSKLVELEVTNTCEFGLYVQTMHHPIDPETDSQSPDTFADFIGPHSVISLRVDVYYKEGYLWVKPVGGTWGFQQHFLIDEERGEVKPIVIEGATCSSLGATIEPSIAPSPSTSSAP